MKTNLEAFVVVKRILLRSSAAWQVAGAFLFLGLGEAMEMKDALEALEKASLEFEKHLDKEFKEIEGQHSKIVAFSPEIRELIPFLQSQMRKTAIHAFRCGWIRGNTEHFPVDPKTPKLDIQ